MQFNQAKLDDCQKSENNISFRNCIRFQNQVFDELEEKAMTYVILREQGCSPLDARKFSFQQHCKVDITSEKLGPSSHRQLKPLVNPLDLYYGWCSKGQVVYNLNDSQNKYRSIKKELKSPHNIVSDSEKQFNKEYKLKMQYLREFYMQNDIKYGYSRMDKQELYKKLQELEEQRQKRESKPTNFLKNKKQKFFEVAELVKEDQESYKDNNFIQQLKAFKSIIPENQKKKFELKEKFFERKPLEMQTIYEKERDIKRKATIITQLKDNYEMSANPRLTIKQNDLEAYELFRQDFNNSYYCVQDKKEQKEDPSKKFFEAAVKRRKQQQESENRQLVSQESLFKTVTDTLKNIPISLSQSQKQSYGLIEDDNQEDFQQSCIKLKSKQSSKVRKNIRVSARKSVRDSIIRFEEKLDQLVLKQLEKTQNPIMTPGMSTKQKDLDIRRKTESPLKKMKFFMRIQEKFVQKQIQQKQQFYNVQQLQNKRDQQLNKFKIRAYTASESPKENNKKERQRIKTIQEQDKITQKLYQRWTLK